MITLIKYYADWCAPCKAMQPAWEEAQKEFKDVVIFQSIDVESNPQEAKKNNVRTIPTLIAFENGKEIERNNSMTYPQIEVWLDGLSGNL
jgi:thiol-disulfide isomerase/thioredoxin